MITYAITSHKMITNKLNVQTKTQHLQYFPIKHRSIFIVYKFIKNKSVALQALTNLGRLSSCRWQSFPTAPDGIELTCGQHIESHSCIFSFPNRTVLYSSNYSVYLIMRLSGPCSRPNSLRKILRSARESNPRPLCL
jgi:hypothetical protein